MEPSKLRARSIALAKEAQNLATIISHATLDRTCSQIVISFLRLKLVAELDELVKDIEQKVQREEEEIQTYPSLNKGQEVWLEFFEIKEGINYTAFGIKRESAPRALAKVAQDNPPLRYVKPLKCAELTQKLRRDILDGLYDEELQTSALKLVYNTLK
ncbi:MAG TPA: hypothetical protein VJZ75_00050 [Candidatus Bathyarchaeia archaeon]|nr:hypothetical protein [Candidatus Bathyarchaeia archaeon]